MVKRPRVTGKPSLPPEADRWAKQAGIDPEVAKVKQQASASKLPLESIKDRFGSDTRQLNEAHVLALAESIAVLGLIEPLAIDSKKRLLAGSHRRAAISLVKQEYPAEFDRHFPGGLVPVLSIPFDSETDPGLALAIETAENTQRKDYTPEEVRSLAERLKSAGYTQKRGKPKPGDKLLVPALEAAIGKHKRTIHRYLVATGVIETNVTISHRKQRDKLLSSCLRSLEKWQQLTPLEEDEMQIEQAIQEFLGVLSKLKK